MDEQRAANSARQGRSADMRAWILPRLGLGPRGAVPEDPADDKPLIARALSYLFLLGSSLSFVWLALPHTDTADDLQMVVPSALALIWGIVLLVGFDRLPMWALKWSPSVATLVITWAMLAAHQNGSIYLLYYFWTTIYAFCFFSRAVASAQTVIVGLAFGVVLIVQGDIWTEEIARWLLTMATLISAAALVRYLSQTLRHRSLHDPLTELPNRRLYHRALDEALEESADNETLVTVIFMDLDRFKYVNDSLGHQAGDELLCAVARRLAGAIRPGDMLARFGGDEFAILCVGLADDAASLAVAQRAGESLRGPFAIGGDEIHCTASVGVAVARGTGDGNELLRDADAAMYRAKDLGTGDAGMFDESLRRRIRDRLRLDNDLRRAVDAGEITLAYQPIVRLGDSAVVAVEALARWTHPQRGPIPPAQFISVAEETGLIVPLGRRLLEEACRQAVRWDAAHGPLAGLSMSVNISVRQFVHPQLLPAVNHALDDSGLPPERLTLEITESVLMEEAATPTTTFAALRRLGVRLALDDFGSGYSSLAYLQRFPLDQLKLDRSFVAGLSPGSRDESIVGAVLAMARALGIDVIAEGIESEAQRLHLERLKCPMGQGYLFAGPIRAAGLADAIAESGTLVRLVS